MSECPASNDKCLVLLRTKWSYKFCMIDTVQIHGIGGRYDLIIMGS